MMRDVQSPAREMMIEYCPGLSGSEMVAKECHSRRGEVLNRTKEPGTGVTIGVSDYIEVLESRSGDTNLRS